MTKLTTEHPAVEAAMMEMTKGSGPLVRTAFNSQALNEALKVLEAALPHLTTATEENLALLRDTPVGRALKAEGWRESLDAGKNGSFSYQGGPIPPGTMTSQELSETEDD